jgi:hypothetical protein
MARRSTGLIAHRLAVLFPIRLHDAIRAGDVTTAIRAWKRPTVVAGGMLQTPAGLLGIDAVEPIEPSDVTEDDAHTAGCSTVKEVLDELRTGADRRLYRIRFHRIGDDPRIALRAQVALDAEERRALAARLDRWDRAAPDGPWTARVLDAIERWPARVSTELAVELGMDRPTLKRRVRELKQLGLTESLDVGYRLSPRGEAYLCPR